MLAAIFGIVQEFRAEGEVLFRRRATGSGASEGHGLQLSVGAAAEAFGRRADEGAGAVLEREDVSTRVVVAQELEGRMDVEGPGSGDIHAAGEDDFFQLAGVYGSHSGFDDIFPGRGREEVVFAERGGFFREDDICSDGSREPGVNCGEGVLYFCYHRVYWGGIGCFCRADERVDGERGLVFIALEEQAREDEQASRKVLPESGLRL